MLALAPAVHHPGPHSTTMAPPSSATSTTSSSRAPSAARTLSPPKRHRAQAPPALVHSSSSKSQSSRASSASPAPARPSSSASTAASPDIATYSSSDLLRLLAQLLNRIATANDKIYHASTTGGSGSHSRSYSFDESTNHVPPTPQGDVTPLYASLTTASRSSVASPTSPLFFHARNVPTISIESYLLRILKYCPTTNEVFLSLLVYFDRMNKLGEAVQKEWEGAYGTGADEKGVMANPLIIDSYNIHRLIIAGVTVASKFFSDVFYTNSRYAKVGGLPTQELNKLELQFLLLNDFRLAIPPEELQLYFEQLLRHASGSAPPASPLPGLSPTSPGYELFGDAAFSSVLYPSPSSHVEPRYDDQIPPAYTSTTSSSSVAPTPSTTASTVSISTDGVASSSSTSTITQSTFANEGAVPMVADSPIQEGKDDDEEDEDPTIRVNRQDLAEEDEGEEGRRTPHRNAVPVPIPGHSQYSSYANTELAEEDQEEEDIAGQTHRLRRDESPAASLRYVNGQWDRGSWDKSKKSGEDGDDDGESVNEVVVYRGESSRGRGAGSSS